MRTLKTRSHEGYAKANFKLARSTCRLPAELMEFLHSSPGDERFEIVLSEEMGCPPWRGLSDWRRAWKEPVVLSINSGAEVIFRVSIIKWKAWPRREMKYCINDAPSETQFLFPCVYAIGIMCISSYEILASYQQYLFIHSTILQCNS